jgi:hypothetical protein
MLPHTPVVICITNLSITLDCGHVYEHPPNRRGTVRTQDSQPSECLTKKTDSPWDA